MFGVLCTIFFFNDTATTEIYTLSLHDALPIYLLTLWVCKLLMLICILTKNVITSCSVTMMLFLHLEVKPLMTLTTVLYLSCALISGQDRKSGSAGMPRPISYAVFCLKKKIRTPTQTHP